MESEAKPVKKKIKGETNSSNITSKLLLLKEHLVNTSSYY